MGAAGFGRRRGLPAAQLVLAVAAAVCGFLLGPTLQGWVSPALGLIAQRIPPPGLPTVAPPSRPKASEPSPRQAVTGRTALFKPAASEESTPPLSPARLAFRGQRLEDAEGRPSYLVAVFHTHTSEMYRRPDFQPADPQAYHRFGTPDTGVVRVGRALAHALTAMGVPTLHVTTVHDYPDHRSAYRRSEQTVRSLLARYPGLVLLLDVHRDAPQEADMLVTSVDGGEAARVALVVAVPGEPDAQPPPPNLLVARRLVEVAEARFPGMMRRVITVPGRRYNQHLHPGLLVVEVGSYSTWEQDALRSARLLAVAIAELVWELAGRQPKRLPAPPLREG